MLKVAHAQSGGFAGKGTNVCTHGYTDISTDVIGPVGNYDQHGNCWNELKGYVHKLVPAQIERYRNIGVWRCKGDAHLSVHAQYWSWSDASKWRREQLERWGQFKLRNPPNAKLTPEEHIRRSWTSQPRRRSCGAQGRFGGRESNDGDELCRTSLAAECHCSVYFFHCE